MLHKLIFVPIDGHRVTATSSLSHNLPLLASFALYTFLIHRYLSLFSFLSCYSSAAPFSCLFMSSHSCSSLYCALVTDVVSLYGTSMPVLAQTWRQPDVWLHKAVDAFLRFSPQPCKIMDFDKFKKALLSSAKLVTQPYDEKQEKPTDFFPRLQLRHWSVAVPTIFRANSLKLNPDYYEKACIDKLITPLEWFITGSDKPKELLEKLKNVCPPPDLCGKVFKGGEPVYNCRDCGMDGTCVLCVDCFKNR